MWLRRAFYWWMFPAVLVLPLWLLIGWVAFNANGWALLLVLLVAMPSVFVAQLALALLVRARGSVRATRAVSWWDVLGFGVWHVLVIATGLFSERWFAPTLVFAVVAAVALVWLTLWQLWSEMRNGAARWLNAADETGYIPPQRPAKHMRASDDVVVLSEAPHDR